MNNSFATVSPDGQWLVSGEWGDHNRLQVFPAPLLNPSTPRQGGDLPEAGQITLDKPERDIQGCDFVTDTRLLCASDGRPVTGTVKSLLALPRTSACTGTFEAGGATTTHEAAPCAPR